MSRRVALLAFVLLGLAPGFAHAQDEGAERLRIHGSNVLGAQVVPQLVDAWLKEIGYSGIRHKQLSHNRLEIHAVRDELPLVVEIDKRGTASGLADLAEGNTEIAMSARQPNAKELDAAWQLGELTSPGQEWVVGLDGLAVLVAPNNTISELSVAQIRDVASGRTSDWHALGGPVQPIHVYAMARGTGTAELTSSLLLRDASLAPGTRTFTDRSKLLAALRADPAGIGIVALRAPRSGLKALSVRSGALASAPERMQVSSEDYPLQRRVYFHTGQLVTALGRGFAEYALSPAGQAIVEHSSLLPVTIRAATPASLGQAPDEYRTLVTNAKRLPMTVRFGHGLDLLDSRSRQDVERLAQYLARPENAERRVLLMGFANPEPRVPYRALALSQERVDYLSSELLALGMKVTRVRGFGGSRSLVDATDPSASYRNTRVEVWLR